MEYKVSTSIPVQFELTPTPPYLDTTRFQAVKIWICHTGLNYNNSVFTKDVIETMIPTLAGIPILGYISANKYKKEDFNGHEERLVIKDGDISIEYIGSAYGCILENNNAKFEFKTLPNGEEKEFLTCEGILWKKFAKCIEIFDRDGFKGHSMELNPNTITGHFSKDGHYYFDNASFDGLCILGDEVQPAMIGSIVEKFAVEPLKLDFTQLLTEINNSIKQFSLQNQTLENKVDDIELNMQKGGTQIVDEKIIEVLKQFNLTPENIGFSIEGMSVEDLKTKLNEQFTMSANQLDSAIRKELNNRKIIMNDSWDGTPYEVNEFYLRDIKGSIAIVINYDWDTYFGIPFTITGDVVVLDFDAKIEYVSDWREKTTSDIANNFSKEALNDRTMGIINQFNAMKDKINSLNSDFETSNNNYSELKSQYDEIKNNFDTLNTEVEPLRKYQKDKIEAERKLAENELFNQYDEKLNTIEAYQKLKETASQYTIQNLEKEIALIYVKFTTKFSTNKSQSIVRAINNENLDGEIKPYGGLMEKYLEGGK